MTMRDCPTCARPARWDAVKGWVCDWCRLVVEARPARVSEDPRAYKREYMREYRRGRRRTQGPVPIEVRILAKLNRDPGELVVPALGPCWVWEGATNTNGYGLVRSAGDRRLLLVHRVALATALGREIAPGMFACHRCDNRRCARPSHLYEGAPAENSADIGRPRPVARAAPMEPHGGTRLMPISPLVLQRQMRELGRIRTGNQIASGRGRRPNKLETFRFTAESRELVEAAAEAFGGSVVPWRNGERDEWEVITTTATLDIVVPPGQPVTQWMELWSGGGCQRRCDGVTEIQGVERNGEPGPCLCPQDVDERIALAKDGKACKATTRLNVMLPQLPDLGVWRLESHGYYAAVELAGAAEILAMATARGTLIPARLRLEQRERKVPGKPTLKYAVPIIELLETRIRDLQLTAGAGPAGPASLGTGERPARPELPQIAPPATSDFRAPFEAGDDADEAQVREAPASLTQEQLLEQIRERGIAIDVAGRRSQELFPRDPQAPLTGEQRAALLEDLITAAAAAQL
jgi:hypothetical protein